MAPTIHATAVLVGAKALLIRGAPGTGKTRLALRLVALAEADPAFFARIIADDRVHVASADGRLVASAPAAIAGLVEHRGLGVRPATTERAGVVGLVIDLDAPDGARMPEARALSTALCGVTLPRLPVAAGVDPMPLLALSVPWCRIPAPVLAATHPGAYR